MSIDFNSNNETSASINENQIQNQFMDSGSESAFIGSWSSSSSSSFLTTSFGSELDSNDADLDDDCGGDEFIAELTRRMADYMLEENEDAGEDENQLLNHSSLQKRDFQKPKQNHEKTRRSYADTVKKSIAGFQQEQSVTGSEQLHPPVQLYQVENQPRVGRGRKGKMSESTQHAKQMHSNRGFRGGKELVNGGKVPPPMAVGSGMRAIFLGGSGSRNMMSGTGVFLPRSFVDATDHSRKKKSGCSTVLVPTRVLQALEQHFNNIESLSSSNKVAKTPHVSKEKKQTQESVSVDHQDSRLPPDWIY